MNVASPSRSAQSRSQVARSRDVSSRGSPLPPSSAVTSGFVRFRRPGFGASADQTGPGGPGRGQQRGVVTGQDGNRPRPPSADRHEQPARPRDHVRAPGIAQIAADQPGAGPQADPPRLHGPYWQWTRKVAAKTICRWLSAEQHRDYTCLLIPSSPQVPPVTVAPGVSSDPDTEGPARPRSPSSDPNVKTSPGQRVFTVLSPEHKTSDCLLRKPLMHSLARSVRRLRGGNRADL
jgi:hypothetical protein